MIVSILKESKVGELRTPLVPKDILLLNIKRDGKKTAINKLLNKGLYGMISKKYNMLNTYIQKL